MIGSGLTTVAPIRSVDVDRIGPLLWRWLQEFPKANLDDGGPRTELALTHELWLRLEDGERLWECQADGEPVGAIGYVPLQMGNGMLHGVCFTQAVHGTGMARVALMQILAILQSEGVRKVSASYFSDNERVRRFLRACGFKDEGYLREQTIRGGAPIDMVLVAKLLK